MTPSDFSVLLLAWDDADPSVAVLGGAALPPTLLLAYHLAQEQPVLAVFPHLPEDTAAGQKPEFITEAGRSGLASPARVLAAPTPTPAKTAAATAAQDTAQTAVAEETKAAEAATAEPAFARDAAGIRRLTVAARGAALAFTSVLVGLEDRAAAAGPAAEPAALPAPTTPAAPANAPARSQWPTGPNAPQHLTRAAPAAPYLGASVPAGPPVLLLPVPPLVPAPTVREVADLAQAALSWPAGFSPLAGPVAAPLLAASAVVATEDAKEADRVADAAPAEMPKHGPSPALQPNAFGETTEEMGAAEANDLSAPEDDLTLDAPAESAPAAEAEPLAAVANATPAPALAARRPPLDGLNSRMIQYARQAAQLVQGRSDFGVIYAPSWPAWLAALEIRNSSRRPLVLYAASLAADFAGPAERGWLLEVERMTLRRAHLILVPTEQLRQRVRAQYGTDTGEVRVVPADDEAAVRALLHELAAG